MKQFSQKVWLTQGWIHLQTPLEMHCLGAGRQHLLPKCEGFSWDPQNPQRANTCNPDPPAVRGEGETGESPDQGQLVWVTQQ